MAAEIEVGDIVIDEEKRALFVVKRYVTPSGFEACDCVLAEDDQIDEDSWQNPMFFYVEFVTKVFSPGKFWPR